MAHAVVAGGGIGGLTAAVALQRRGWSVTVCERAPELEPVGAGIAMTPNALAGLDAIGVGDAVRRLAAIQGPAGIRRSDGRWLVRAAMADFTARYGDPTVLLLRATLTELLAERLRPGTLHLGVTVHGADPATGTVRTSAGELAADLVVAADGIRSPLRGALFPGHPGPRYAGFTSWRVVVPRPPGPLSAAESWGRGSVFGVMPMADDLVYCYATAVVPAGGRAADERAELLRRFGDWHAPIPALLASAAPDRVLRHDIHHLATPLPAFHRGRIALVGDAAHAMTPNLGQGGCQAIEDAVTLAHLAAAGRDLAEYTAARRPRTTWIARRSAALGRLSTWSAPVAVFLRDRAVALAARSGPGGVPGLDRIVGWRPPA